MQKLRRKVAPDLYGHFRHPPLNLLPRYERTNALPGFALDFGLGRAGLAIALQANRHSSAAPPLFGKPPRFSEVPLFALRALPPVREGYQSEQTFFYLLWYNADSGKFAKLSVLKGYTLPGLQTLALWYELDWTVHEIFFRC